MEVIRVLLFDDSARFRLSLKLLFEAAEGFYFCGAFADAKYLSRRISKAKPDVVLWDINMREVNSAKTVALIKSSFPEINILMLTVFEDDEKIMNAMLADASGFILKNRSLERLILAVQDIHNGGVHMNPGIARKVLNLLQHTNQMNGANSNYHLTNRQLEVLRLVVKGASYKMIADQLRIGYSTVHSHMKQIYKKLQVNSMSEAIAKAIHYNIVNHQ